MELDPFCGAPTRAWEDCTASRDVRDGEAGRRVVRRRSSRDCIALVGCTLDSYVFPIAIFEPGERVEPREVAAAIRECFKTYDVRELICQEDAWTWVLLEMESEQLPVVKMPLSPQRLGKSWQVFSVTVMEHRLTHSGDAALARHVSNLTLRSDRSGVRPELELASPGAFVNRAVAAMIAYERVILEDHNQSFAGDDVFPENHPLIKHFQDAGTLETAFRGDRRRSGRAGDEGTEAWREVLMVQRVTVDRNGHPV